MIENNINIITGAPRLEKTTYTFKMAVSQFETTLIYVSRTINTFEKTIDTVSKYVPLLKDVPITPLLSNINACPIAKKIYDDAGYDAVSIFCSKCSYKRHQPNNVYTPIHLTPSIIKKNFDDNKICPEKLIKNRILYFNKQNIRQIIIMTYARLKYEFPSFIDLENISVIFDEARHITEICILKQVPLNKESTKNPHKQIISDYVSEIKAIDFSMLSPVSQSKINTARDIFCNNILTMREFEGAFNVKDARKELLELLDKKVISINAPSPPPPTYKSLKAQIEFLNLLNIANKHNVSLDDEIENTDKEKSVNLIIREMIGKNIESRANFKLLADASRVTYLVDSTPYPREYHGFWLGEDYEITDLPFKPQYPFNIVIENVKRRMKDTFKDKKNMNRFVKIIKGVRNSLSILIFTSSKNESLRLKKLNIDNKHARGNEVEGVQSDNDYTLITRLPLQNINSEKYRDATLRAMTGKKGFHSEYIYIKAYAELLQMSFRTAKIGKISGSFWMSLEPSIIPILKKYWPWLDNNKHINFLSLEKKYIRVADKVDYVVQGLTQGNLGLKRADRVISQEIIAYFTTNPNPKIEDCVNSLHHRKDTVRRLIRHLKATGQI